MDEYWISEIVFGNTVGFYGAFGRKLERNFTDQIGFYLYFILTI